MADTSGNKRRPGESQREFLIRTGKITPFSKIGQDILKPSENLGDVLLDAEDVGNDAEEEDEEFAAEDSSEQPKSRRNLLKPGFVDDTSSFASSMADTIKQRPRKRRKVGSATAQSPDSKGRQPSSETISGDEYLPKKQDDATDEESDYDGIMVEGTDEQVDRLGSRKRQRKGKRQQRDGSEDFVEDLKDVDDGNENLYQSRLNKWITGRKSARNRAQERKAREQGSSSSGHQADIADGDDESSSQEPEWFKPHPTQADTHFDGGFRIPGDIYPALFDYQKTGVQWLWELHSQKTGGIVGDEMGLGKTIQVISLLAGLHYSKMYTKPTIVVCPATVMKQWVNEFHRWWPPLRVSILHSSGSGMMDVRKESKTEECLDTGAHSRKPIKTTRAGRGAQKIVNRVLADGHVLVTTYSGLQAYAELLIPVDWGYAILDEGHKIRNPDAGITIYSKELRTPNRLILSGTPIQNNLTELWSLFDFVFPMRLGTLVNFRTQFEIPIRQGGYANASNLQVETALKCAETLKDAISPYLLQRWKSDVASDLPSKSEQVLFCKLTKPQRESYEFFLNSEELKAIYDGNRNPLFGIDILRKICNHPDLVEHKRLATNPTYDYGRGNKSGKMQVVKALVQLWRENGHKTLLFCQHRIMLDILEKFLRSAGGISFVRMDGSTNIKDRQNMVDRFNSDPDLHVFLLTTKVGGLGINLTGADRVIIYDPDWNPSTDVQARERAWRLGQKREVLIYRLMTAGTIEEKIYHRQLFKQFLTHKILKDPKQRQTFNLTGLHDLFSLGKASIEHTETGDLFKGAETRIQAPKPALNEDDERIADIQGVHHSEAMADDHNNATNDPNSDTSKTACSPSENNNNNNTSTGPGTNHLNNIFARSGVHSSLSHDAIFSSHASKSTRNQADPALIAAEARRVAADAAAQLQRASEAARTLAPGTVTWTGTFGSAGRPDPPPSSASSFSASRGGAHIRGRGGGAGPSSSSVLANLAARHQDGSGAIAQPRGRDFLAMIRDYLIAHGGKVYTQMLIDHFNRYCGSEERTAEFKEMLRLIAVLKRPGEEDVGGGRVRGNAGRGGRGGGGVRVRPGRVGRREGGVGRGGRGMWVLRREYGGSGE